MLSEMADAEGDEATAGGRRAALPASRRAGQAPSWRALLSGEADANDAYLEVNSGAGGTEAHDWAEMLLRMYLRWAEAHGTRSTLTRRSEGEQAGIKSATMQVTGPNAYGWLKSESGVHRLVRISPYDSAARRHTPSPRSGSLRWSTTHRDRDQSVGRAHRHLPRLGRGRSAHQQDGLGRAADPLPTIPSWPASPAAAAPEPRQAWKCCGRACTSWNCEREAAAQARGRRQDRYRLGSPDPVVRAAAVPDGEGSADQRGDPDTRRVLDGDLDEFMGAALAQRVGATRSEASAAAR